MKQNLQFLLLKSRFSHNWHWEINSSCLAGIFEFLMDQRIPQSQFNLYENKAINFTKKYTLKKSKTSKKINCAKKKIYFLKTQNTHPLSLFLILFFEWRQFEQAFLHFLHTLDNFLAKNEEKPCSTYFCSKKGRLFKVFLDPAGYDDVMICNRWISSDSRRFQTFSRNFCWLVFPSSPNQHNSILDILKEKI